MKASELIKKLEELKEEHGDLEVGRYMQEFEAFYKVNNTSIEDNDNMNDENSFGTDPDLGETFIGIG